MTLNNVNTILRIQKYIKGELSSEEMNQLEREALDDPFLQDAIDGYSESAEINTHHLTILQQRLQDRIMEQPQERGRLLVTFQRLGVGAVACLLFLLACVLLWMVNQGNIKKNTKLQEIAVELNTNDPIPSGNGVSIVRNLSEKTAAPAIGWEKYNEYVKNSKKITGGQQVVVVSFKTDAAGRPIKIKAKKGTKKAVEEVVRLLINGPAWEANGSAEIEFVFE